jgi:hypothetical protein
MKLSNIENIISLICHAPTYLDWHQKWMRVKSDFAVMREEWVRMGGFKANTGKLLDFLSDYSLLCVEYAKWTPTTIDDQIVKAVRYVITDHRDILMVMIEWIRQGHEPQAQELEALAEVASTSVVDGEYGSPMMTLYIIATLYQILQFLKSLDKGGIPKPPQPDTIPKIEPLSVNRPVLNLIRKLFGKEVGVGRLPAFS